MTTATLATGNSVDGHGGQAPAQPRRAGRPAHGGAVQGGRAGGGRQPSAVRSIHEARRLRQTGDVDGALAVLAGVDTGEATPRETRWVFAEWKQLVKRRFGGGDVAVYSQGAGRAAALVPGGDGGTLEVAAVLGMRWRPGKVVSRTQPPGAAAPDRGCVMVTANVDIPALKARHPAGRHGGGGWEFVSGAEAGSVRASVPSTTRRRAASRCTPTRSGIYCFGCG